MALAPSGTTIGRIRNTALNLLVSRGIFGRTQRIAQAHLRDPGVRPLPKVDVMITNGGYGGVQFALAHGVAMVVAGDTEEKPEIAARVAWSGTGISLKTGSPTAPAIAAAVQRILVEPGFRLAAQHLRDQMAAATPLESITQALAEAARSGPVRPPARSDLSSQVSMDRPTGLWMASAGWPFPVPFVYRAGDAQKGEVSGSSG